MSSTSRRHFLATSSPLFISTTALAALTNLVTAAEHQHSGAGAGLEIDATARDTCATCQYWGGMRKISDDKKGVVAQSMGWCNNPDSMNYQKLTTADHKMMKTGIWKKWGAL